MERFHSMLVAFGCVVWLLLAGGCGGSSGSGGTDGGSADDGGMPIVVEVSTIREAVGANPAAIQATVDTFRADLGSLNPAVVGSQGAGRRQINWDGVSDADAAASRFPADFFNAVSPRGVILGSNDPRATFQVSADAANPAGTAARFGNLNATYSTAFQAFSAERLFTPLGTNTVDVHFVVPGTSDPAVVTGFGAVFVDADNSGTTRIEFFDVAGNMVLSRNVLSAGNSDASQSFLGVMFSAAAIARVRLVLGDGVVLSTGSPNDITQGGAADIVALDDFIYGEPQPQ